MLIKQSSKTVLIIWYIKGGFKIILSVYTNIPNLKKKVKNKSPILWVGKKKKYSTYAQIEKKLEKKGQEDIIL